MNIKDLTIAWSEPNQPMPLFNALEHYITQKCGCKLLTYLLVDGQNVARLYSNMPDAYPVLGRKHMGPTDWGELLIKKGQPFLGKDRQSIEWAFFDHKLIFSLGLGSVISVPVRYDGQTLGVISMLDQEYHYNEQHLTAALEAAAYLVPAFLIERQEIIQPKNA